MRRRARRFATTMACLTAAWTPMLGNPSAAWADEPVTYEVVSEDIQIANIEYQDSSGRASANGVTLPWRTDATVRTVRGAPPDGSQVRADWRPSAAPARWVTVRIIYQGKVICQNTLDVGDATCYGITPRIT
ncbi:hypothetical protein BN000_01327 [Mycobacterium europaeum]|uniref:Secreted protein n=2 Tax=Mycobacterium europaeum TaxID=761804 RepID=A0A0U1D5D0_9MYCO|nr:hypothetical protein BN000_01327 [Mycobacterium europaeum]